MGFKSGVIRGTVLINDTLAGTTNIAATSNTGTISIGNTLSAVVNIDCGTAGITVGTTANAHTSTFGSATSTSATTVQSGSGALNVTATNGALTINSGTGALGISTDASATTLSMGTGAAAKLVTVGSTNGASSLSLKTGTADFSLASATGTIMSALDTGEITYPLQTAFSAYLASGVTNATGDGTVFQLGTSTALTEVYDQNSDFNTNGTLTAPVTGRYELACAASINTLVATSYFLTIITSNRTYQGIAANPSPLVAGSNYGKPMAIYADMDAGDTATANVAAAGTTKTVTVNGGATLFTYFQGILDC